MQPQREETDLNLLKTVAEKTGLQEGEEAIRKALREIYRNRRITTKKLAFNTQLPIPIAAAIRHELENEGMITRDGGASLTPKGEEYVKKHLGLIYPQTLTCTTCQGRNIQISENFEPLLGKLTKYLAMRPKPLPWLDQAHGTPRTALIRALFMLEKGDVEGKRIMFLGDDDFTSIAVGLLTAAKGITVVDIDKRLLESISNIAKKENIQVTCFEHDLRKPLPSDFHERYDVIFTDPPYTIPGLALFVSRGITALQRRKGLSIYLAFSHQPPDRMLTFEKTLNGMGLAVTEQIPRFNTYEGAEMFANTTLLARLETTEKTKPMITGAFEGKLYTGEITKTIRTYQCQCGQLVDVGSTEPLRTVEELKAKGCPKCGKTKGFKLIRKQKLKEALVERLRFQDFRWANFPAILEFEKEISIKSFPEAPILEQGYHKEKLQKAMEREPKGLKVALIDDEVVGWLWLRTERDRNTNEKFGYIKSIAVKPEHRHQDFGRKLIEVADNYFLSKGIHRVDLIVSATNYEAAAFFEEAGFEREHSTMRRFARRERERK